jgi:hypothetical protein
MKTSSRCCANCSRRSAASSSTEQPKKRRAHALLCPARYGGCYGPGCGVIDPKIPWLSPKGPAVKNSVPAGPPEPPLPKFRPHKPSIYTGRSLTFSMFPIHVPLEMLNATMAPLPKFPTRRSLANPLKLAGACATPHGAFR